MLSIYTNVSEQNPIKQLFSLTPELKENPVGKSLRKAIITKIKASFPGICSYESQEKKASETYVNLLFPELQKNGITTPFGIPYNTLIERCIPTMEDQDWIKMSVGLVFKLISTIESKYETVIKQEALDIITKSNTLIEGNGNQNLLNLYQQLMKKWQPMQAHQNLIDSEGIFNKYKELFKSEGFINQYKKDSKDWAPDFKAWWWFHQWLKISLMAEGTDKKIENIIDFLKTQGIDIPPQVQSHNWRVFKLWLCKGAQKTPFAFDAQDLGSNVKTALESGMISGLPSVYKFLLGIVVHSKSDNIGKDLVTTSALADVIHMSYPLVKKGFRIITGLMSGILK
ncbi:hypothetical protein [Microscilla marina]|uniref:Uncharacterized protein n=1 Tax=Microscilla marina ATCC 23134 TaxID=313606 RepID=A1ZUM9_MICM2|nr:hypothetical protein [Microscilla marina]EAY25915.1 hypothetical protein M23134_00869 [Microscilla marina ATCC 23134]